jgi:hypothetical protein
MAFVANVGLYTELFKGLKLTDTHREELRAKRGFTDATIDSLGFKSALPENGDIIKAMLKDRSVGDMFDARLIDNNKQPAWQFTQSGLIIIPYLTSDDSVTFYKSHKLGGLTDSGVMPYCSKIFKGDSGTVILCESEFKAAAMWQMGYRALGLGGIASFAGKHLEILTSELKEVKKIIILFDTEIQDDPSFANFKDSYKKRYAQYVWSYIMAKKLHNYLNDGQNQNVEVLIASLPDEWIVNGKADIDGCVAAGKTKDDFEIVLRDALKPDSYKDWIKINPEHKAWIMRKMESAFKNNIVFDKENCLYTNVITRRGKLEIVTIKEIANFKIGLLSTTKYQGKIFRDIQLINRYGDKSRAFHMASDQFATLSKFKEVCLGTGDFLWKGNEQDFNNVVEAMFLETEANPIILTDYAGRLEDHKAWAFSNVMIFDDGTVVDYNDEYEAFAFDDKLFRVQWQGTDPSSRIALSKDKIDPEQVALLIHGAWGTPGLLALGYAISILFSNVYFNQYKCFPIGLFHGEAGSGKSTLSDILALISGFPMNNPSMNISNTTQVGMSRKLAFYSSLPVRFDEHRTGDKKIEDKYSILRSFYNRQNSAKGTRFNMTSTYEVDVRGAVVVIGEQRPDDYALLTRCVPIFLSKTGKTNETLQMVNELMGMGEKLSNITFELLKSYTKNSEIFIKNCIDTRDGLADKFKYKDINFRAIQHFAGAMAGLSLVLSEEMFATFSMPIMQSFFNFVEQQSSETVVSTFMNDLMVMKIDGEKINKYIWYDVSTDLAHIYVAGVHQMWQKWKRSRSVNTTLVPLNTLTQYLQAQSYVTRKNVRKMLPDEGTRVRTIEMKVSKKMHETIRIILGNPNDGMGELDEEDSDGDEPINLAGQEIAGTDTIQ